MSKQASLTARLNFKRFTLSSLKGNALSRKKLEMNGNQMIAIKDSITIENVQISDKVVSKLDIPVLITQFTKLQ